MNIREDWKKLHLFWKHRLTKYIASLNYTLIVWLWWVSCGVADSKMQIQFKWNFEAFQEHNHLRCWCCIVFCGVKECEEIRRQLKEQRQREIERERQKEVEREIQKQVERERQKEVERKRQKEVEKEVEKERKCKLQLEEESVKWVMSSVCLMQWLLANSWRFEGFYPR